MNSIVRLGDDAGLDCQHPPAVAGGDQSVKRITKEKAKPLGSLCNTGKRLPQDFFECPAEGGEVSCWIVGRPTQNIVFAKEDSNSDHRRPKSGRSTSTSLRLRNPLPEADFGVSDSLKLTVLIWVDDDPNWSLP